MIVAAFIVAFLAVLFAMGAHLFSSNVAQVASNAGFAGTDLVTAIAIAYAESSGNPKAVGDNGTSYGLWQIHWTVHRESYVETPEELFDPQKNASAAFQIYSKAGNTFRDWSTFTSGAYQAHLERASSEVSA